MEGPICSRHVGVLCLVLVASSLIMGFKMPKLKKTEAPSKMYAKRDFYRVEDIYDYEAGLSCMTTGPSCIRHCLGQKMGSYQSCTSCDKYVMCSSNGGMMLEMSCPSGSTWDSMAGTCRTKSSRTCIPCPANSVSWFKDKHYPNYFNDQTYFAPGTPVEHGGPGQPDFDCDRTLTMKLNKPAGAKAVQFYMTFYESSWQYTFHISNHPKADGWSKYDKSRLRSNRDAEIHSYNGGLYAFNSTKNGGRAIIDKPGLIRTHLHIKITNRYVYVNNFRGYKSKTKTSDFKIGRTIYFGLNRIINKFKNVNTSPAGRIGSGLDAVWISWVL